MEQGQAVIDLDKLVALATAATPGPWRYDESEMLILPVGREGWCGEAAGNNDGEFIAALNPATVLALIARARRAESILLRCRERLDAHKDSDDLWEEINSWRRSTLA